MDCGVIFVKWNILFKIYKMKKFSLIIGLIILSSCKTSKSNCDAYSDSYLIRTDSTIVKVYHCHIEEENYCQYSVDTFFLKK